MTGKNTYPQPLTPNPCETHGGNIYAAACESGISEQKIIDFSASINPLGLPGAVISEIRKNSGRLHNYPDPDSLRLTLRLAKHLNITQDSIICGNGSTELIYLIARALRPEKILLPAPTFSEYERACRLSSELRVVSYGLKKENDFDINPDRFISTMERFSFNSKLKTQNSKLIFLCNPNNPTGRLLKREEMLKIAAAAKRLRCYLVIDEAFIDFLPEESIAPEVEKNPFLIVLRSMTKFYAFSGLRLGYGIFPVRLGKIIKKHKEPWTVNTLAQKAGIVALNDTAYAEKTFRLISGEKRFMEDSFRKLGIKYVPSSVNYYLIKLRDTKTITASLRSRGILIRDCSNFKGLDGSYVRVAVKSRRDNARLLEELKLCREQ